jgi:hypothetical protein
MTLRKIHLWFGWFMVLAFVLTGQYMRRVIQPMMEADPTFRFSMRANHVYLLLFGLAHLLMGAYFQPLEPTSRARLQQVGSVSLVLASLIALAGFLVEPKVGAERPVMLAAMVIAATSTGLHLLAVSKLRGHRRH